MKIKKEHLEKARLVFGVTCLAALMISAVVVSLPALKATFFELGHNRHNRISTNPPYNFPKADSLLQATIHRLEQRELTKGEIDPYFHRFGNMETHYQDSKALQEKIHQLALNYPKPAKGVTYDYEVVKPIAQPLLQQASSLTDALVVETYDLFHNKLWWTAIFFVSIFGAVYGFLEIEKR